MTKNEIKQTLLSMVTVKAELVQGKLNVDLDLDLDGATEVLFDKVIEPAAEKAYKKTDNVLDDSLVTMAMPIVRKEAVEYMAELEEKVEAAVDEKLDGKDEE